MDWLEAQNVSHEVHNVTTADGYQLQVQRLPNLGAKSVLLVHGLLGSSLGWVCLGPERSLGKRMCTSGRALEYMLYIEVRSYTEKKVLEFRPLTLT